MHFAEEKDKNYKKNQEDPVPFVGNSKAGSKIT